MGRQTRRSRLTKSSCQKCLWDATTDAQGADSLQCGAHGEATQRGGVDRCTAPSTDETRTFFDHAVRARRLNEEASRAGDRAHDERRGRCACQGSTRHVHAVAGVQYSTLRQLERCWGAARRTQRPCRPVRRKHQSSRNTHVKAAFVCGGKTSGWELRGLHILRVG